MVIISDLGSFSSASRHRPYMVISKLSIWFLKHANTLAHSSHQCGGKSTNCNCRYTQTHKMKLYCGRSIIGNAAITYAKMQVQLLVINAVVPYPLHLSLTVRECVFDVAYIECMWLLLNQFLRKLNMHTWLIMHRYVSGVKEKIHYAVFYQCRIIFNWFANRFSLLSFD